MSRTFPALVAALLLAASPAVAITSPDEMLKDPALEARARALGRELRCLVCQNQSIDDSNADLAKDLRRLVRERIAAGDSDEQVLAFLTERYGDFVLLKPPVKPATWLLWFGPPAALLGGAGLAFAFLRGRRRADLAALPDLDPAERARLERLLAENGGTGQP